MLKNNERENLAKISDLMEKRLYEIKSANKVYKNNNIQEALNDLYKILDDIDNIAQN